MKGLSPELKRDLQALGLIALLVLAWLWPVTVGGRLLSPADMLMVMQPWRAHAREVGFDRVQMPFLDAIQQHYPWRKFAAEELRRGEIPLWNPYMAAGAPFVANNQSAVFYPETWLFALMPPERAFGWSALLSLIMGGGFMYWFLRELGLRRLACLAGVVPFLMNGFMAGWLLLPTVRAVPMWLPLLLLAYEKALKRRSLAWAATCGLALGMQFLAGHLHVSIFVMMIFGAYVVYRVVGEGRRARDGGTASGPVAAPTRAKAKATAGGVQAPALQTAKAKASGSETPPTTATASGSETPPTTALGLAAVAVVVGLMLAAIQVLPVLELAGMTTRKAGIGFAETAGYALPPVYLLLALLPNMAGSPVDYNFWGNMVLLPGREYIETVWYLGLGTLVLMAAALAWRRGSQTWFWAATFVGGLGMACGTVLYRVCFALIPPLRQLTGVSRAVFICTFAAAVLAALGLDALLRRAQGEERKRLGTFAAGAGLTIGLVGLAGGLGMWLFSGQLEQALPGIGGYTLAQMGKCLLFVALAAGAVGLMARQPRWGAALVVAVLAADLLLFAGHLTPEVPAKYLHVQTQVVDYLQQAMREGPSRMTSLTGDLPSGIDRMSPNTPMCCGLQDAQSSDSLVFEGYGNLWNAIPKDTKDNPCPASPVLDLLNCKYLVTSRDLSGAAGWRLGLDAECRVYERTAPLSRAYLAASETQQATGEEALAAVSRPDFRPRRETITPALSSWQPTSGGFAPLSVAKYETNRVVLSGPLPAKRLAVLGDVWYPGWRAYLDGREQRSLPVNYCLRGATLEQAGQKLEWVYYPASFAVGAFLACLAVLLMTAMWVAGRVAR